MTNNQTFADIEAWAKNLFADSGKQVPLREIQLLLMAAGGLDRAGLIGRATQPCPDTVRQKFEHYVERRLSHEPVYRIIGKREFHGLQLELNEATLEPRDDTECLVEIVLAQLANRESAVRFLDLGTGTGAIALALLSELPNACCVAVDVDPLALQAAAGNAELNGLRDRFEPRLSNWFDDVTGKFDFIVSNPPYIASSGLKDLELEVRQHDPLLALDGGEDGLDAYRHILADAGTYLCADGFLGLEIGHDQKTSVSQLAHAHQWGDVLSVRDIAGQDRVLLVR